MVDVLVVEDNEELGPLVTDFLEAAGYTVYLAASGEMACEYFEQHRAKVVLLDLMLPEMDGYDVCDQIRQKENVPIIIISAKNQKEDKLLGFDLGADDYVEKPFDMDILMAKIAACLRRSMVKEKNKWVQGNVEVNTESHQVFINHKEVPFSVKEIQLLMLFFQNKDKVLRKEWIFDQIWGTDSFSEPSTLTVHINKLREKIEKNPKKPERIVTVWGVGYKFI